jgi:hypothetical protein
VLRTFWLVCIEAWRMSRRNRISLIFAVLILAAGLSNCIFSTGMQASLFREDGIVLPLHFSSIGEIDNGQLTPISDHDVLLLRAQKLPELAQMVAISPTTFNLFQDNVQADVKAAAVSGIWVDAPLFTALKWPMQLGRDFAPEDFKADIAGDPNVPIIISNALWLRELRAGWRHAYGDWRSAALPRLPNQPKTLCAISHTASAQLFRYRENAALFQRLYARRQQRCA